MQADVCIGGGASAQYYRHPLLSCITDFLSCLGELPDPGAACRVWWTPVRAALAAILMVLDRGGCLRVRFEDARACLAADFATGPRSGGTYNGLFKALERQADTVLPILKCDLRSQARRRLLRRRKSSKWILLAVDGSKEALPRTRDLEAFFGIADNGKAPQILMTTIVEVTTGMLWDWRIDRGRGRERDHLFEMMFDLPARALLLGDGNFVGYPLWSALGQAGKSFLIRVGGNVRLLTRLWPDAEVEYDGDIVYAWPKKRRQEVPLMLRLLKVGRQCAGRHAAVASESRRDLPTALGCGIVLPHTQGHTGLRQVAVSLRAPRPVRTGVDSDIVDDRDDAGNGRRTPTPNPARAVEPGASIEDASPIHVPRSHETPADTTHDADVRTGRRSERLLSSTQAQTLAPPPNDQKHAETVGSETTQDTPRHRRRTTPRPRTANQRRIVHGVARRGSPVPGTYRLSI